MHLWVIGGSGVDRKAYCGEGTCVLDVLPSTSGCGTTRSGEISVIGAVDPELWLRELDSVQFSETSNLAVTWSVLLVETCKDHH